MQESNSFLNPLMEDQVSSLGGERRRVGREAWAPAGATCSSCAVPAPIGTPADFCYGGS